MTDSDPITVRDPTYLVKLIALVTNRPFRDVANQLRREFRDPGVSVKEALAASSIEPHEWSSDLVEFYDSTDAFLYETLCWNRSPTKQEMCRWTARLLSRISKVPSRILVFGDGLGFDSLFLAEEGHHVDFHEVSKMGVEFARHLFDDSGVDVRILPHPPDSTEQYDVIVCLDVLEHVPDPAGSVRYLAECLKPGGLMIVHAPFWFLAPEVSTHLRSSRKFSGDLKHLFTPFNLRPIAAEWFWNPIAFRKETGADDSNPLPYPGYERLRVRLGGLLLAVGRFWSQPHLWVYRWLRRSHPKEWIELDRLIASEIDEKEGMNR